jgi:hypothetical protein
MRRTILANLLLSSFLSSALIGTASASLSTTASAVPPDLERALGWIPESAVSFVVVPNLKKASNDLEQLVEATGQGGVLAMGRPIDLLKAQLGVGSNLDENGPLVAYFPSAAAEGTLPVFVLPCTDATAFLNANLKPAPESGEGAFTNASGLVLFAKPLEGRVALATDRAALPADGARGISERFTARVQGADENAWLERADLIAWGSRDALAAAVAAARRAEIPDAALEAGGGGFGGGFGGSREEMEANRERALKLFDMLADGIVTVDVDPLGLFIGAVGVGEPMSPLASLAAGGTGKPARFAHVPQNPFYLAIAANIDALGGPEKFGELLDLAGIARDVLPAWFYAEGKDITDVELAAYPSKLGVAIGGALNDSALFIGSRNPSTTLARVESGILALAGESNGLRREPAWNAEKKLKTGDVVAAFEIKETVIDATKRPGIDIERLAKQFIFGSRGVNGLAKKTADGVVITFSQRPDVYARAMEAAAGAKTLAKDDTVASIEEWLPAARDVEVMLGLGQLTNLVGQIASSFMGEEEVRAALPKVPADTEPIAFALDLEGGRTRAAVVVPAAVLKLAARTGLDRAVAPNDTKPSSAPSTAPNATPPATPAAPSAPAGDAP